jgi:hypothetical protein
VPHVFAASSTKLLRFVQQQLLFARPRSTAECEVVVAAKVLCICGLNRNSEFGFIVSF